MLKAIDKFLEKSINFFVTFAITLLVVLVAAQTYTRFCTSSSLTWSEELSTFVMVWMAMLGSISLFRDGGHMAVDNFVNMLPHKVKHYVLALSNALVFVFLWLITIGAYDLFPTVQYQLSPACHFPMANIYLIIPVSFAVTSVYAIRNIFVELIKARKGEE